MMGRLWQTRYVLALAMAALAVLALHLLTRPPALPSYADTRAAFRPSEAWLYDRHGTLLDSERVDFAVRRLAWVPLEQIAPVLRQRIVQAEDRRFLWHGGIDWLATFSVLRDRLSGKRPRGASTLSMQLAAYLAPDLARPGARSVWDKLRQMRAAQRLEADWSKRQILEAYLNLAGYRGEAQGIGAASYGLFGKPPAGLGEDDAVLLAALLPDPQASVAQVARRACAIAPAGCGRFGAVAAIALGPERRLAIDPGLAPHLAAKLLRQPGARAMTTLDLPIQRMAAAALRRHLVGLGDRARDGAVVVVDNASADVLAYVGGIGGGSTAGSVDGADAYRQAGSTLKPFLYAQAMERGYLTPASILEDSPVQLDTASGLYVPQNYDRAFKGPVTVRSALAGSLNVPAVRTLLLTGVEAFRDRLWDVGYHGLTEDGAYYGFSLALGSAEVTLLEQAAAYRALANGGRWSPLRLRTDAPAPGEARQVFSPQAAFLVANILADPGARAVTFGLDSALRLPFWAAVKTGTSKAMRDNWCIGFTDRFTVAVWIGNLEGDSMRAVSGTSGAAPVWREIMLALHRNTPGRAPAPPSGVERRQVAFADGLGPMRSEYFLAGTSQAALVHAPPAARRARISDPVSGAVFALDPDIPLDRQRIRIAVSGPAEGHRLVLDDRAIGPANGSPMVLAGPGRHSVTLLDAGNAVIDRALFTVR